MAIARPEQVKPRHPGEFLLEEFLKPLNLTQANAAHGMGISFARLNEILNGKRPVTLDTALRIGRYFGTEPNLWISLQRTWDLWEARQDPTIKAELEQIVPYDYRAAVAKLDRAIKDMKDAATFEGRSVALRALEEEREANLTMLKRLPTT
ncbi:MAG TPA: HigA family addiction module antitoxin [Gemmatimonadales bacterium]|nr:HigA family addiction module antitoxin [Gemmatimonadales bacterium]